MKRRPLMALLSLVLALPLMGVCQNIVKHDVSVQIAIADNQTAKQVLEQAKTAIRLAALEDLPEYVELQTHYDSRKEDLLEKAVVTQGAIVHLDHIRQEKALDKTGQLLLRVTADVSVDTSAIEKKLAGIRQQKALRKELQQSESERVALRTVLEKIKSNELLSQADTKRITDYMTLLNQSVRQLDAKDVTKVVNTTKDYQQSVYDFADLAYLARYREAKVDIKILGVQDHPRDVSEVMLSIKITPHLEYADYRALMDDVEGNHWRCLEVFEQQSCASMFADIPRQENGFRPANVGRWEFRIAGDGTKLRELTASHMFGRNMKNPAIKRVVSDIAQHVLWLTVTGAGETLRFQIIPLSGEAFSASFYVPKARLKDGINLHYSVDEEIYVPADGGRLSQGYRDLDGHWLRYAQKEQIYYRKYPD